MAGTSGGTSWEGLEGCGGVAIQRRSGTGRVGPVSSWEISESKGTGRENRLGSGFRGYLIEFTLDIEATVEFSVVSQFENSFGVGGDAAFYALQLRSAATDTSDEPSDGGGRFDEAVVDRRRGRDN